MSAHLGARHPYITTRAILSGSQNGRNMGQTLQSLGLSGSEAKQARRAAARDTKDADKRVKDADKRAKDADKRARRAHDNQ